MTPPRPSPRRRGRTKPRQWVRWAIRKRDRLVIVYGRLGTERHAKEYAGYHRDGVAIKVRITEVPTRRPAARGR